MASTSSPRKSGRSGGGGREEIACLLLDGARFHAPAAGLLRVAEQLKGLGLLQPRVRQFVRCVDELDLDFSRVPNRPCQGVIYLDPGLDEDGDEYRCEDCGRPVYPGRDRKRRHRELHVAIRPQGVMAHVRGELAKLKVDVRDAAEGVLRIDLGDTGVYVCVLDFCREARFRPPEWVRSNRTCYVTVKPGPGDGAVVEDGWLAKIPIAVLVAGEVDLGELVLRIAEAPAPKDAGQIADPGNSPTPPAVAAPAGKGRRFIVRVGPDSVQVEGVEVIGPRAERQLAIFGILWAQYLDDLREGRGIEQFRFLKMDDIVKRLGERTGGAVSDMTTVRRYINRLQEDIETGIRKTLGLPIDREDIVQTRPRSGGVGDVYGYRINPRTVWPRPFEGPAA